MWSFRWRKTKLILAALRNELKIKFKSLQASHSLPSTTKTKNPLCPPPQMPNPYIHHQKPNQKKKITSVVVAYLLPWMHKRFTPSHFCQYTQTETAVFWAKAAYEQTTNDNSQAISFRLSGASAKETAHYHLSTFSLLEDWVSVTKMPVRTHRQILRKKCPNSGYNKPHYCCAPVFLYSTQPHLSTSYW